MRALLIYPKHPGGFWSLEQVCHLQGCKTIMVPLGLLTVAALLPPDWQLRLVNLNTHPLTEADWEWAEALLISGMIFQRANFLDLVREAKARGKTVVAGGPYPSVMPEEVMAAGCDFLVRGEAELVIPHLLEGLEQGKTGSIYQSEKKPDLSLTPIPRYDLLRHEDYLALGVQTTRGCPHDCEFCDVVSLFGRKVRKKSPDQVLAELEALYRMGVNDIFISDDNFVGNKAYARQLLHQLIPWLKERGEPFTFITQTTVNLGQEKELIDLMTEANFGKIFIGVESPDEEVLQLADKHHNLTSPLVDSVNALNANGLSIIASFILGLDGETSGAGDRIIDFAETTNLPILMLNLLFPFSNTRLGHRLQREGRLREDLMNDWLDRNAPEMEYCSQMFFQPTRPEEEIITEYFRMVDQLYEPSAFLARAYRSILAMRPTRSALAAKNAKPPSSVDSNKKRGLIDIRRFARLAWSQGVKAPCRRQFWEQLYGVWQHNPSRVVRYLTILAWGNDMFLFRERLRQYRESLQAP